MMTSVQQVNGKQVGKRPLFFCFLFAHQTLGQSIAGEEPQIDHLCLSHFVEKTDICDIVNNVSALTLQQNSHCVHFRCTLINQQPLLSCLYSISFSFQLKTIDHLVVFCCALSPTEQVLCITSTTTSIAKVNVTNTDSIQQADTTTAIICQSHLSDCGLSSFHFHYNKNATTKRMQQQPTAAFANVWYLLVFIFFTFFHLPFLPSCLFLPF